VLECPTLPWVQAVALARTLVPADGVGRGWVTASAARGPATFPRRRSHQAERDPTSLGAGGRCPFSSAAFRARLEHTGGIRRKKQAVQGQCCRRSCLCPTRPASYPTMAEHSRRRRDAFLAYLTNGKVTKDKVGHGDLLPSSLPGCRTSLTAELCVGLESCSGTGEAWREHCGGLHGCGMIWIALQQALIERKFNMHTLREFGADAEDGVASPFQHR